MKTTLMAALAAALLSLPAAAQQQNAQGNQAGTQQGAQGGQMDYNRPQGTARSMGTRGAGRESLAGRGAMAQERRYTRRHPTHYRQSLNRTARRGTTRY